MARDGHQGGIDTQAKPDKRDKNIINAVNKIFKNYPPKQKSCVSTRSGYMGARS